MTGGVPDVAAILGTSKRSTVSGIVERTLTGDRIVPESRRADGSVRKERKIRPGYTPPEEVEKFKSARQLDNEQRQRPKNVVPGMATDVLKASVKTAPLNPTSKAQRKNLRRRDKREDDDSPDVDRQPPDDWDVESVTVPPVPIEDVADADLQKRLKSLNKKLRQAQTLQERRNAGEVLLPQEDDKIAIIPSLEQELAKLAI